MPASRYQQIVDDYCAAYAADPTPENKAARAGAQRTADADGAERTRAAYRAARDEAAATGLSIAQILQRNADAATARRAMIDAATIDDDEPTAAAIAEFLIYEANDAARDSLSD